MVYPDSKAMKKKLSEIEKVIEGYRKKGYHVRLNNTTRYLAYLCGKRDGLKYGLDEGWEIEGEL